MEELNNKLTDDLREKEDQLGQMEDDLNDLRQALAKREVPPATPPRHARASQTTEPYPDRVKCVETYSKKQLFNCQRL